MTRTKREWRGLLLKERAALNEGTRQRYSAAIAARIAELPEFKKSRALLLYTPLGAEVDVRKLATGADAGSKVACFPSEVSDPAWFRQSFASACHSSEAGSVSERPVLIAVPGVGFDLYGTRLGRGRGFYDAALAELRRRPPVFAIGVAFEIQVVPRLPRDLWDQSVDLVVTESRLIIPMTQAELQSARCGTKEAY